MAQTTYVQEMDNIIGLFEVESLEEKIKAKQLEVMNDVVGLMMQNNPDYYLSKMVPECREEAAAIFTEEPFNPTVFSVDQHFRGFQKLINKNFLQIKEQFQQFHRWAANEESNRQGFDVDIDIREQLNLLNINFPYNLTKKAWKLPRFTLSDDSNRVVDFPGMYISLDFNRNRANNAVKILTDETANFLVRQGDPISFFHPHVNHNGEVCMGEVEGPSQIYWEKKELFNLVFYLCETLSVYNPASPYRKLEYWAAQRLYKCDDCGADITENNVHFIDDDESTPACGDCSVFVASEGTRKWRSDYVRSVYQGDMIRRSEATKAYVNDTDTSYIANILGHADFKACPACNTFVHKDYFKDGLTPEPVCIRCFTAAQLTESAEQEATA